MGFGDGVDAEGGDVLAGGEFGEAVSDIAADTYFKKEGGAGEFLLEEVESGGPGVFAEPDDVGAEEFSGGEAGEVFEGLEGFGLGCRIEGDDFPALDAFGLADGAVETFDAGASGLVVEIIDIGGEDGDGFGVGFEFDEGGMGGVGGFVLEVSEAGGIPVPDKDGVLGEGLGGGKAGGVVVLVETSGAAESGDAAGDGDSGSGVDEDAALGGLENFGGPVHWG